MATAKSVRLIIQGFKHRATAGCCATLLLATLAVGMSPTAHAMATWVQPCNINDPQNSTTCFAMLNNDMWRLAGVGNAVAPPFGGGWPIANIDFVRTGATMVVDLTFGNGTSQHLPPNNVRFFQPDETITAATQLRAAPEAGG